MKRWLLSLFFFLSFTSLNNIVYSQEKISQSDSEISEQSLPILQENSPDNLNIPSHNFSSNIFWFIIFILFLSLVGFVLLKILRNTDFSLNSPNLSNNLSLKILFEFPMGKNNSLKVIEFYSQIFLIAESSQGISLISKIEDREICNQILIDYSTKAPSEKSLLFTQRPFSSLLQSKIETVLGFSQKRNSKTEKELGEISYDDKKKKEFLKNSHKRLQEI